MCSTVLPDPAACTTSQLLRAGTTLAAAERRVKSEVSVAYATLPLCLSDGADWDNR